MKRTMIVVLLGVLVAGCASTGDIEKANAKIAQLERKVAILEKKHESANLSRSLLRRNANTNNLQSASVSTQNSSREAERQRQRAQIMEIQKELRRKREKTEEAEMESRDWEGREEYGPGIKAFVKEYLGVEFGEPIERCTNIVNGIDGHSRLRPECQSLYEIPLTKKFWYFNAFLSFCDGKLTRVYFIAKLDVKYSEESCDAQFEKVKTMFAETVLHGAKIPKETWGRGGYWVMCRQFNQRSYELIIADVKLRAELETEIRKKKEAEDMIKRKQGEALPELK